MSWEVFRCRTDCSGANAGFCVDETTYKAQADALVAGGFRAAGYRTISIDDCWERRGPGGPHGNETWRKDPDSGRVNGSLAPNSTRFPVRVVHFTNGMLHLPATLSVSGKETQSARPSVTTTRPFVFWLQAGLKALGDYMHQKGVKFGIYSDEVRTTCDFQSEGRQLE